MGCQRPQFLGRPGAWPVSCAARKRWPRGSKASRLDALRIRRAVGFQEEAVQVSRPCLRSSRLLCQRCKGLPDNWLQQGHEEQRSRFSPPPKRAKWPMRGDLRGVPKAHPGLPTSPFDAVRLPSPAPVVLSNLLTRFYNSSSAGAKKMGHALPSCAGGPFVFLVRSQRILPLPWPVCSGILPHSMSSDLRIQSTNILQSILILLYHLSQVPWPKVHLCGV